MKIPLKQAINNVLAEGKQTETFDQLINEVIKITQTKYKPKTVKAKILDYLEVNPIAVIDTYERIWIRKNIGQKARFRIKLTLDEFQRKELIVGHRLIPFMNTELKFNKLKLIDGQDKQFQLRSRYESIDDFYIFYSLFDVYSLSTFLKEGNDKLIQVFSFDLSEWIEAEDFKQYDRLLLSTVDYEKGIYKLDKITKKEEKNHYFLISDSNRKLESSIEETLKHEGLINSFDHILLISYGKLNESIFTNPPSALLDFLNHSKKIELFNSGTNVTLKLKNTLKVNDIFDDSSNEIPKMGVSKTVEGIFRELGLCYTENFIKLYIMYHYKKDRHVDGNKLCSLLFSNGVCFYNKKQETNFIKAFNSLLKRTFKQQEKYSLDDSLMEIALILLNSKVEFIDFLRELDDYLDEDENLEIEVITHLYAFDEFIEAVIYNIVHRKVTNSNDLEVDFLKNYKKIKNRFHLLKEEIKNSFI